MKSVTVNYSGNGVITGRCDGHVGTARRCDEDAVIIHSCSWDDVIA